MKDFQELEKKQAENFPKDIGFFNPLLTKEQKQDLARTTLVSLESDMTRDALICLYNLLGIEPPVEFRVVPAFEGQEYQSLRYRIMLLESENRALQGRMSAARESLEMLRRWIASQGVELWFVKPVLARFDEVIAAFNAGRPSSFLPERASPGSSLRARVKSLLGRVWAGLLFWRKAS